jgi:O-antigen/teichoic acid export membrane protein
LYKATEGFPPLSPLLPRPSETTHQEETIFALANLHSFEMNTGTASNREKTIRNVFFNLASQGLILGTSFITTPYIVNKLGADSYGVVILLSTILGYLSFLDLGLSGALIRYLTECASVHDWERFRRLLWSSLIFYASIGPIIISIFAFIPSKAILQVINIPPHLHNAFTTAFFIGIAAWFVGFLTLPPHAILWAYHRLDMTSFLALISGALQPILTVTALFLGYGIVGVSIATLLTHVTVLITAIWMSTRLHRRWGKPIWDPQSLKPLFRYGGWLTLAQVVIQVVGSVDKILIGSYLNPASVGYYSISVSLPLKLWIIHGAFVSSAFPLIVSLKAHSASSGEVFHLVSRFARSILLLLSPFSLFFMFFGYTFVSAWINEIYARNGLFCIMLASVYSLISGFSGIFHVLLRAWERPDLSTKVYLFTTLGYLPLLYVFIRWLGISGGALALVLFSVIELFLVLRFVQKIFKIKLSSWHSILLNRHFFILMIIGALLALIQLFVSWNSFWKLSVLGGTFLLLSGSYVWFMGLSKYDRTSILQTFLKSSI